MKTVLIMDGNNMAWRYYHTAHGEGNKISEGVLRTLGAAFARFTPSDAVVCWDEGASRWRKEVYKGYKENRKEGKEKLDFEMFDSQVSISKSRMESMGVRQFSVKGIEADDLVRWIADYYCLNVGYGSAVLVTCDRDLWQIVDDGTGVMVYDPFKGEIIREKEVAMEFGVRPSMVHEYKSLVGDKSDNIEGVHGIGEKKAAYLFGKYGGVGSICSSEDEKDKPIQRVFEYQEDLDISYRLSHIPRINDAKWYVNESELEVMRESLCRTVKVDVIPHRVSLMDHMARERSSDVTSVDEKVLSLRQEDLTGMLALMDRGKQEEYLSFASLDEAIQSCNRCVLRSHTGTHGPTLADGYSDVKVMAVARNPGAEELKGGRPLIGPAGRRFDRFLENVGLTRRDVWITNVCKCYSENNRPLLHGEMIACSSFLRSEINLIKPKLIIAFGNEAMNMLTPYAEKVSRHCGEIIRNSYGLVGDTKSDVAVCVHPSAVLRNPKNDVLMQFAERAVKEYLEKEWKED